MAKHGRYRIVRRVADGGMAEIFLATQMGREGFQKPVILKRIHSAIYADPQFRNMFIDEAHISMSLSHSNIVQILDLGSSEGRYFLVLELVDGWDLGRVLHRAGAAGTRLPRELGLYIIANVCRALAYAHGKTEGDRPLGIVHRDVSPHNILLSEQGEVKLTDFGIAKAMNKREQTGTGVVKGKVAFMSPEQAMGKPIDARSDLFSLGTILYLIMTRVRPFEGPTDLETLLRVQKGDFTPPEAIAPDLEPEVAAIIARAMRMDPAERYQTADEMLNDLEGALRTVFNPVGQTELKRWLAQLAANDGAPSIGRATERQPGGRTGTGSGELDGNDVVLFDSTDEEEVDGEEATSLAVGVGVAGGHERPRISRARSANSLPMPTGAEAAVDGRASEAELALPIPDEEPPHRRRARRGGSSFTRFVLLAAIVGPGAWFGAKYARQYLGDQKAADMSGTPSVAAPNPTPPAEAKSDKQARGEKSEKLAKTDKGDKDDKLGKSEKREAKPATATTDSAPHHPTDSPQPGAAHHASESGSTAREPGARRAHPGEKPVEKQKDRPHRTGPDLKGMMAPDPSLLPAAGDPAPSAAP